MLAIGIALAFGAALAWSGLDATRKVLTRHFGAVALVVLLTFGQAPLFVAWGWAERAAWPSAAYWPWGIACLLLNVLANVGFVRAVRLSPLSLTVPMLSFTPVLTALAALPLLGEVPSPAQVGGIVLVVIGAMTLHGGGSPIDAWRRFVSERGSVIMLGVALCWSLTSVLDKAALEHISVPYHAVAQTAGVGLVLLAWLVVRGRLVELRPEGKAWAVLAAAIGFATAAIALQLLAIQQVLVALVETLKRAVGMTAAVVVGRIVFDEPVGVAKALAIALMAAGTALVLFG